MFLKCMLGLYLRVRLLFNFDANLLHYFQKNQFSESMTLLFMNTNCTMAVRICAGKYFHIIIKFPPLCKPKEHTRKNHTNFIFMVVERLLYFHLMNCSHTPLVTCRISSISFYDVSKRMISKSLF